VKLSSQSNLFGYVCYDVTIMDRVACDSNVSPSNGQSETVRPSGSRLSGYSADGYVL